MRAFVLTMSFLAAPASLAAQDQQPLTPPGYHLEEQLSPRLYVGAGLLGGIYGLTVIQTLAVAGAVEEVEPEAFTGLVPVIGPFISLGFVLDVDCGGGRTCETVRTAAIIGTLFNGIGQVIGLSLILSGLSPDLVLVPDEAGRVSVSLRAASPGSEIGASVEVGWL